MEYGYVLVFFMVGVLFVLFTMWFSWALRPHHPTVQKLSTYECGELPFGEAKLQFNFRYYVFALLFVVFEMEIIFLFLWALMFKSMLGWLILAEGVIFILVLLGGLIYVWKEDMLKWV